PTGLYLTKKPPLPMCYSWVWTNEFGEHLYGVCLRFFEIVPLNKIEEFILRDGEILEKSTGINLSDFINKPNLIKNYYAPKCICIISYYPFILQYRTFLTELYRISLTPTNIPIERFISNLFLETPLPPNGYF